jgi:hypothetical protein
MKRFTIDDLKTDNFDITVRETDDTVTLAFHGSIELQEPHQVLDQYFKDVHQKIIECGLAEIYCDFNGLSYINSSGIKCLLQWILKNYRDSNTEHKYSFIFIIDEDSKWQTDGIGFLKKIAPDIISIRNKMG